MAQYESTIIVLSSPQVFYGSAITDPVDSFNFAAVTEHWMHAGGPKREAGRYHIPSQF